MKLKKTKKGFTLIELIVVVVVLAILAAVAVPMISSWVGKAQEGEAAANARTIELAVKAYIADKMGGSGTITEGGMTTALEEFGLSSPLSGSKTDFKVNAKGNVTYSAIGKGDGTITFQ